MPADSVARVDPASGVMEEAGIAGDPGSRIFSVIATPPSRPVAGVVICSPILAEVPNNYRREVVLSRRLAGRGVAVIRFHYRGAGHSDGESGDLDIDSMEADTRAAANHLVARRAVDRLGFVGTRLGALVAAAGSRLTGNGPVALWEPVVAPTRYFGEILRAQLVTDLAGSSRDALLEELQSQGWVDVLGYRVERSLYASACARDLVAELGDHPRPVLLVHFGRGVSLADQLLGPQLEQREFAVTAVRLPIREAWWFPGGQDSEALSHADSAAIDVTVDWLSGQLAGPGDEGRP